MNPPTKEERIARLKRMRDEYEDEDYSGPTRVRALGQLDVEAALKLEGE